jgi:DinB family protein
VPRVPAVALDGRAVHGWNPAGYAELLGVPYAAATQLAPRELGRRLDQILESAQGLVSRFAAEQLDVVPPERKRSIRDLGYHVFRVGLSFIDAMDRGDFPPTWFDERAPAEMIDGGDVARWGALVRGRIAGWFEGAGADEFGRVIDVYYGPQGAHDLLERTTWHCAQHLRQLYVLAERLGVRPPAPLPVHAFADLPLPDALW